MLDTSSSASVLRDALVDRLQAAGAVVSAPVEAALRAVPREVFLPGVPLEQVYADDVVIIKRNSSGRPTSSASAPWLVATMLEQARLEPGHRVLEIGTATGVNARYLRELVGDAGVVASVEIDAAVVEGARRALAATGAGDVTVVHADGEHGVADLAPFDRIVVTVQAYDLAGAWWDQLAPGGRLVVPLTTRTLSRGRVFVREEDHLRCVDSIQCGFVDMQGAGAPRTQHLDIADGVTLHTDDAVDPERLRQTLLSPAHAVWTGVPMAPDEDVPAPMDIWLATWLDVYGKLWVHRDVSALGRLGPTVGIGNTATWTDDGGTFAYVTWRDASTSSGYEVGVHAHGPRRHQLGDTLAALVRRWHHDHRGGPEPTMRAYRAGTPDELLPAGRIVDLPHTRLVLGV